MRILTRTQTEAIYEIIRDLKKECDTLKKENEELREKITNKGETIEYLTDKILKRTEQLLGLQGYCNKQGFYFPVNPKTQFFDLDFPATQKPEDKTI